MKDVIQHFHGWLSSYVVINFSSLEWMPIMIPNWAGVYVSLNNNSCGCTSNTSYIIQVTHNTGSFTLQVHMLQAMVLWYVRIVYLVPISPILTRHPVYPVKKVVTAGNLYIATAYMVIVRLPLVLNDVLPATHVSQAVFRTKLANPSVMTVNQVAIVTVMGLQCVLIVRMEPSVGTCMYVCVLITLHVIRMPLTTILYTAAVRSFTSMAI